MEPIEDEGLLCAMSDGEYVFGIWPVLYGWRIRAGKVNDLAYYCDWCCGDNAHLVWGTYEMMKFLLSHYDIHELPPSSDIKPWPKDEAFGEKILSLLDESGWQGNNQIINRPNLVTLRQQYYQKIGLIKAL